jgi:hypothetical protein
MPCELSSGRGTRTSLNVSVLPRPLHYAACLSDAPIPSQSRRTIQHDLLVRKPATRDHGNLAAGNVKSGARRRWHVAPPRPALGLVKLGWRRQGGNFSTARDDFGFVASLRRKHRSEVLKHRRRRTAVPPTRRGYRAPHADFTIVALLHECETVAGGD